MGGWRREPGDPRRLVIRPRRVGAAPGARSPAGKDAGRRRGRMQAAERRARPWAGQLPPPRKETGGRAPGEPPPQRLARARLAMSFVGEFFSFVNLCVCESINFRSVR